MFIKQIIIQGFKSYKDQTEVEPFSPKTNVVVGRNGSGKSNFFAAIRFVLSDAYNNIGREERQALLHEGSGSAVMSAYVEIIFDNGDDRFHTGKDEVILRRTIGQRKDEYSVDRKNVSRKDVMDMLASAGFSPSNPYYIVPQGRVTALTNMKDLERLNLLKEVAGTKVYEARRVESIKIMMETNHKRAKIDESLEFIKQRLAELEAEMEELREYQEKDKDRRCLEYAFHHRQQNALAAQLEEIDELRQGGIEGTDDDRDVFMEGEKAIQELEAEIKRLIQSAERLKREGKELDADRRETAKIQAGLELTVKTLLESQSANEQSRSHQLQSLNNIKQGIAQKESELIKLLPEYKESKANETEIKNQLDTAESRRSYLYTKQGRNSRFRSKKERDTWLQNEIRELKTALGEQEANRINADEEVTAVQSDIQTLDREISELQERLEGWSGTKQTLQDDLSSARDKLLRLREERKDLRREEENLAQSLSEARQERDRAQKELSYTMDGGTSRGLATIERLKRERNISGAYGTLAELITVPELYRMATEQTAGNSLFHYIVDNEKTASYLMGQLHKEYGGRVTFMPLAQLNPRHPKLPNASDAVPLMNKLSYDKKFEKAVSQVFGKTVVCPSLSVAGSYARSHNCSAITPEGDTANKKGAMTGGYLDPNRSRLEAVRLLNEKRAEYESLKQRGDEVRALLEQKDTELTTASGDEHRLQQKLKQFVDSLGPLNVDLRAKRELLVKQQEQLVANERRREEVDQLLKDHADSVSAFETELGLEFKKTLSADEEIELDQLNTKIQDFQRQWNELCTNRRELESRKQMLEDTLLYDRRKLDQLNSQDMNDSIDSSFGDLRGAQKELKRVQRNATALASKLQGCEAQFEECDTRLKELQKEKSKKLEQQEEIAVRIEKAKRRMDKATASKALLIAQAAECAKTIRDLGVLPDEAFEKYTSTESKTILKRLNKVHEALKYKKVNKKAFEQYNSFTNQRDGLIKRRKELDDSQASIQDLIEVLDQRKDETIERTFRQVSKEFATIFERLVPAGRGRLVIQRKTDNRPHYEDSEDEPRESVENYVGVGISVSFNSKHDEQQRIQQLSGGQKSLCALALVFAIQKSDPAPFYLFDEIDANLDAQYRTAVAQMLEEISSHPTPSTDSDEDAPRSAQFICTTFRPEMLHVADKCYGVTFHNKTSGIDAVSREEALKFVEGEAGPK